MEYNQCKWPTGDLSDFRGMWVSGKTFSDFRGTEKTVIFEEQNVIFGERDFRGTKRDFRGTKRHFRGTKCDFRGTKKNCIICFNSFLFVKYAFWRSNFPNSLNCKSPLEAKNNYKWQKISLKKQSIQNTIIDISIIDIIDKWNK